MGHPVKITFGSEWSSLILPEVFTKRKGGQAFTPTHHLHIHTSFLRDHVNLSFLLSSCEMPSSCFIIEIFLIFSFLVRFAQNIFFSPRIFDTACFLLVCVQWLLLKHHAPTPNTRGWCRNPFAEILPPTPHCQVWKVSSAHNTSGPLVWWDKMTRLQYPADNPAMSWRQILTNNSANLWH